MSTDAQIARIAALYGEFAEKYHKALGIHTHNNQQLALANTIEAVGFGAYPPRAVNQVQAHLMARRAAIADAYRQLAEMINGVNVDAETTVEDMITASDIVKTKVIGTIKGAEVISEREILGGGYEVTVKVPLFGVNNSLASAVIPRHTERSAFPKPFDNIEPSAPITSITVNNNMTISVNKN